MSRVLALLLALALVVAACGGDDTSDDADATDTATTNSGDDPGDIDGGDDAGDDDPADDDADDAGDDTAPVELTATDDGVTADAVRIAAVFPDLTVIGRDNGDVPAKFQAVVDRINADGGVNGRMIELVDVAIPNPIGDVAYEEACVRHTEDEMVFAVVGIFLREQVLCYSEFHDTVSINVFAIDDAQLERSTAPLLSIAPLASRSTGRNLDALIDNGHLESGMRVALHGVISDEANHDRYEEELAARDIDVVVSTLRTIENDPQASVAEVEVFAARWLSEDVDAVIGSSEVVMGDLVGGYDGLGLDMPMLLPEGSDRPPSIVAQSIGVSLDPLVHAVVLLTEGEYVDQYADDVNGVRECVDAFAEVSGEEIFYSEGVDVEVTNLAPATIACQAVELFTAVAIAAGPDLTTESFGAAAAEYGPITITAVTEGSLGPDKPDVTDTVPVIGFYDPATDLFAPAP